MPSPQFRRLRRLLLLAPLAAPAPAIAQDALVPAGTINGAVAKAKEKGRAVLLVQDDPAIARYAAQIAERFYPGAKTLTDAEATAADLAGHDLLVYGTPEHAWLAEHAARLPFRWSDGAVEIDGRKFEGKQLRVICAIKSPEDPACRALIYAAARPQDVVDMNSLFHGPTEWLVADGGRTLAAGSFMGASLSPAALRQDLDFLVRTIVEVHPATTDGPSPELQKAADAARAALDAPMSRAQAWRVLAPVLLALRDAHASMGPPQSGEPLDLPLVWLPDGGLIVAADAGGGALRRGDRVVELEGHDEAGLLVALQRVVAAENAHWVCAHGERLLADLGVLRALGLVEGAPVHVRLDRDGQAREVSVGLAGPGPRSGSRGSRTPWVRYEVDKEADLGLFTLDQCTVDATYLDTLDAFFTEVHDKEVGRIAVDLRANSGGNSMVVDEFLRYLDVAEYRSFGGEVRWSEAAAKQRGAIGRLEAGSSGPQKRRNARRSDPPPFAGKLFVITGPHTFSSGNWFAVVVQDNGLGQVIGEPTGNAPSSYGDILSFTLPNSALSFTLSYKRWLRPDPARDPADSLVPDVAVPRTRAHLQDGVDPVLEWLRRER